MIERLPGGLHSDEGHLYSAFRWIDPTVARTLRRDRAQILAKISSRARLYALGTKIASGKLSPGCALCVQGRWSCLFVNGLCNADCFYCPQDRSIKEERAPFSQEGLIFNSAPDYAAFVRKFGFKGVSFSGGETLLALPKVLCFIKEIRKSRGDKTYLWLYTNGKAATKENLATLRDAGLNEIRFNISADNYGLAKAALAARILDTVGVEIPMIPEDYALVEKILPAMQEAGIKFLNLHQLSTTRHNYKNFVTRGYAFLQQPRLPVPESEIASLRLLRHALESGLTMPVHYCSCAYQCNFQAASGRARIASLLKDRGEEVTAAGYIRNLSIESDPKTLGRILLRLKRLRQPFSVIRSNGATTRLVATADAFKKLKLGRQHLTLRYFAPRMETCGEKNTKSIRAGKRYFFLEKTATAKYYRRLNAEKWERLPQGLAPIR